MGDRLGYLPVIASGLLLWALTLFLLPSSEGALTLLALTILIGVRPSPDLSLDARTARSAY